MANRNKRKGTEWETTVRRFLDVRGIRGRRTGSADAGSADLHYGREFDWTGECKNEARIDFAAYITQLRGAVARSGRTGFKSAVWIKRRMCGPGDSYVLIGGDEYRELVAYVEWLETQLTAAAKAEYQQGTRTIQPVRESIRVA